MRQELYAALLAGKPPGQDSRHEAFARLQAKTRQDLRLRRLWFLYWRCSVSFFYISLKKTESSVKPKYSLISSESTTRTHEAARIRLHKNRQVPRLQVRCLTPLKQFR